MTADLREGLEACPFCGGAVTLKEIDGDGEPAVAFVCAEGSACDGSGLYIFARANNAEAIAAWNRRSPALLAQARDGERLEGMRWERDHAQACLENAVRHLSSIYAVMNPELVKLADGRVARFVNPLATEALDALSNRIRAIPRELAAIAALSQPGAE